MVLELIHRWDRMSTQGYVRCQFPLPGEVVDVDMTNVIHSMVSSPGVPFSEGLPCMQQNRQQPLSKRLQSFGQERLLGERWKIIVLPPTSA